MYIFNGRKSPGDSHMRGLPANDRAPTIEENTEISSISRHLYLTNEVLNSLGQNWDSACKKIIDESVGYGQKCKELKNIRTLNR
jgi:hypothetical protein